LLAERCNGVLFQILSLLLYRRADPAPAHDAEGDPPPPPNYEVHLQAHQDGALDPAAEEQALMLATGYESGEEPLEPNVLRESARFGEVLTSIQADEVRLSCI
jgi:hypothetical protein